ncbi:MAG: TlpA disulfide reductase family protein [Gammaproteobacteria bacterium]|nr:TlpA disulfide reductase family protein [Gammaproteobacteria bacterium]
MTRRDRYALFGAIIIMAAAAALWLAPAGLGQAPAVTLKTIDGEAVELGELRGRPVLVTFWATTCQSCMKEIPHLIELHETYHDRGLSIIGVAMSYDPPDQVIEFTETHGLPYRIALDVEGDVARAFDDVMLTPTTFLIAPDGRIVMHKIGLFDTGKVRSLVETMLAKRQAG